MKKEILFNMYIKNQSKEDLEILRETILKTPKKEILKELDLTINKKEDRKQKNYNKQIIISEIDTVPINVVRYLLENNIVTVDDLLKSNVRDNATTDHWIEWIIRFLDIDKDAKKISKQK